MIAVSRARKIVGNRSDMDPYRPHVRSPSWTTTYAQPALRVAATIPRMAPSVYALPDTKAPSGGAEWIVYSRDGGGDGATGIAGTPAVNNKSLGSR